MSQEDPTPTPDPTPPPPPDPELDKLRAQNADQARALALAQARIDFPKADAEVLSLYQGTAEGLRSLAEKLHAKELEFASRPGTTPAGTPGPGGSITADEAKATRYRELQAKVLAKRADPWETEEFGQMAFAAGWNQHQVERKAGVRA